MNTVRLPGWSNPVHRAADWLRDHHNIPDYQSLEKEFAEYFNCRIIRNDEWNQVDNRAVFVEFDEAGAAMFLLRWA